MVIKLYFDLMSQPSRALYIFLKLTDIPFEACPVALRKGEHLVEDFKKFNKFQKVPFIHDGDLQLAESVGIFRYLTREYPVDDKWYPRDSKCQAKVDEYLEWQHLNTRLFCTSYFRNKWLTPILTGKEPSPEGIKRDQRNMENCLQNFEDLFLTDGTFINGSKISFADIIAACEIEQPRMAGYEPRNKFPILKTWIEKVRDECNPYYDEAHQLLNKMAEKTAKQQLKANL